VLREKNFSGKIEAGLAEAAKAPGKSNGLFRVEMSG
jgi:hypothetical protein